MKIKITRDTVANKEPVFVGDVVDLDEQEAKYLIAIGKATPLSASQTSPQMPADAGHLEGEVETADLKRPLETSVKKVKK